MGAEPGAPNEILTLFSLEEELQHKPNVWIFRQQTAKLWLLASFVPFIFHPAINLLVSSARRREFDEKS